jgi:hypothetical protein
MGAYAPLVQRPLERAIADAFKMYRLQGAHNLIMQADTVARSTQLEAPRFADQARTRIRGGQVQISGMFLKHQTVRYCAQSGIVLYY